MNDANKFAAMDTAHDMCDENPCRQCGPTKTATVECDPDLRTVRIRISDSEKGDTEFYQDFHSETQSREFAIVAAHRLSSKSYDVYCEFVGE